MSGNTSVPSPICQNPSESDFHIYTSANRSLLVRHYHKTILTSMAAHVRKKAKGSEVSDRNILAFARFYTTALTGLIVDWLNDGMIYDPSASFLNDLGSLLYGNIRTSLEHTASRK